MDSTSNYPQYADFPSLLDKIGKALECGKKWGCACTRVYPDHLQTHCPAHDDEDPSLSVSVKNGKLLVHCHGGCTQNEVIAAFGDRGLWPKAGGGGGKASAGKQHDSVTPPAAPGVEVRGAAPGRSLVKSHEVAGDPGGSTPRPPGLTLEVLAEAKKLPVTLLQNWDCRTIYREKIPAVRIPYLDEAGNIMATRYRVSLSGVRRFVWKVGDHAHLYGLDRLEEIRRQKWVLLVEGESDVWTAAHYKISALGIPGKATWRPEWAKHLAGLDEIVLWQEPGAADLADRVARDIPNLRIIEVTGHKDISAAHIAGADVPGLVRELRRAAVAGVDRLRERQEARVEDLRRRAAAILEADDPLALVEKALAVGYGGAVWRPAVVYLAATFRLLALRPGQIPVHLILLGESSSGKNYTLNTARRLLPPDLVYQIDAGSPRALIYDDFETRHAVVVFGESDSLPAGEDNPAASAIRALLSENRLTYKTLARNPATGNFETITIEHEGPTVLLTTSTRRLGHQLMTRLFTLDIPDDQASVRQVLDMQAQIELDGVAPPEETLIAYQELLQELAPWHVVVPFARALALALGADIVLQPRLSRDHARILSFIKAVTVLRHVRRTRDATGRLVATLDDYAAAYRVLNPVYAATATGVNEGVRRVVEAVYALGKEGVQRITPAEIARKLKMHKQTVGRHVRTALYGDYLKNRSDKERQYDLVGGNPLPDKTAGLPTVERLHEIIADPSKATAPKEAPAGDEDKEGFITLEGEGGATPTGQGRDSVTPPVTAVTQSPASPVGKDPLPPGVEATVATAPSPRQKGLPLDLDVISPENLDDDSPEDPDDAPFRDDAPFGGLAEVGPDGNLRSAWGTKRPRGRPRKTAARR